jgi:hypothetical protein
MDFYGRTDNANGPRARCHVRSGLEFSDCVTKVSYSKMIGVADALAARETAVMVSMAGLRYY